ncbi:hypothetical protein [Paraliobacillus salinarum]|uniref:hypothetical protein n=1 Tax=Paraliobacillus salinarum TaxID=1158996 RepID=UPI0015F75B02|nr:hypothetical protein [Paraliobacillus salinarum]
MKSYHVPTQIENPKTFVLIEGYEIKNKTTFNTSESNPGEGRMIIDLTFTSNDYSPRKYTKFMDDFIKFLKTKEYQ